MNKSISIIRIAILFFLASFTMLFIGGEEMDENLGAWMLHFIIDKSLGVAAGYLTYLLYRRWRKSDKWIAAIDKWTEEDA